MTSPHDTLFHRVMQHPALVAGWLRTLLPTRIAVAVDWSTFAPAGERIPGLRLRSQRADLVFAVDLHGEAVRVLTVVEHKSEPDPALPAQMLRYCVHVLHACRRRGAPEAAVVLPVVLHHGGKAWAVPKLPVHEPTLARSLLPWQPRQRLLVDDLEPRREQDLLTAPLPPAVRLLFLCLRHARGGSEHEVLAALDRWSHVLRAVEADDGPPHPYDLLDAFGWYLLDTTEVGEDALQRAFARHLQHPENNPMTTGQRIRAESRSLGRVEGQARLLLKLLQRRFGPLNQIQQDRIRNATAEELERWTDRVLDAATFDDVVA